MAGHQVPHQNFHSLPQWQKLEIYYIHFKSENHNKIYKTFSDCDQHKKT